MSFDGICIWARAGWIPGVCCGKLQGVGGCTPGEWVQPQGVGNTGDFVVCVWGGHTELVLGENPQVYPRRCCHAEGE